ncbi:hypothetical protein LTR62_007530 [Meristemomyces frigidus]|uniref:ATP synthase subunit delta, mitochondrial n=1 Tax=Meristemomyces frigidus TaxID=1508187 RepID=A0AAN7TEG1_9PEZI|nr:hypothetical protein LTR62_007530 [Meristemomyces frigidus]
MYQYLNDVDAGNDLTLNVAPHVIGTAIPERRFPASCTTYNSKGEFPAAIEDRYTTLIDTMNSFKVARAAVRARSSAVRVPLQRRSYADVAPDKIKLSLALPHQAIYRSQDVVQVNIPAESGEMGILAQHVPSIEQLKPGLVEIIEEAGGSKQFFLSGGFATVQPNSVLSINAVEGYPLEDFSAESVRNQISEAQKIAGGSGSEHDKAEANIELEVLESLQAALK